MKHILEQAKKYKQKIGNLTKCADDATALECIEFFEIWNSEAKYKKGDRFVYNDKMYKTIKNHWASADNTPDKSPALYSEVIVIQTGVETI